jgi:hypothetical protein
VVFLIAWSPLVSELKNKISEDGGGRSDVKMGSAAVLGVAGSVCCAVVALLVGCAKPDEVTDEYTPV